MTCMIRKCYKFVHCIQTLQVRVHVQLYKQAFEFASKYVRNVVSLHAVPNVQFLHSRRIHCIERPVSSL